MNIRKYQLSDCKERADLFYNTVHTVNAEDYTKEQLDVWADGNVDLVDWNNSFLEHYTVVATDNGIIVGFGDIEKSVDTECISVHASITAKSFFEIRGYKVVKEQKIERKSVLLTNYLMEKEL